eukprot:PITA_12898
MKWNLYVGYLVALGACLTITICSHTALGVRVGKRHPAAVEGEGAGWQPAAARWNGPADGAGSEGGACGYGSLVKQFPFDSKVASASPDLYKGGKGCGSCYQACVKCTGNPLCSETGVTVVVADESSGQSQFVLSGTAFQDMASDPRRGTDLLNAGVVSALFRRVPCEYQRTNIAFHVNSGSSAYWLGLLVEYVNGDGDLGAVDLKQANSNTWQPMQQTWGANWALNSGPLSAPFSIRLTTLSTGKTLIIDNAIPENWQANATYNTNANFH